MQLNPNTQFQNGKYRIIRVLGQGGFGITYLAENTTSGKYVAIKEFFPNNMCRRVGSGNIEVLSSSSLQLLSKLKDKFQKEAKHISNLKHPNIIKVHEVFEENNTVYYAMDYIDGLSLLDKLRTSSIYNKDAIQYILKIANALSHVHQEHITHLDIKPGNIMIRKKDNEPILIDFGLSKHYDTLGLATTSMAGGFSIGYSPIEQLEGRVGEFSPQTDIYALGATLYSLLTQQAPPFASMLRTSKLSFPPTVTTGLQNVINKAMAYDITNRYSDCQSFYNDLKRGYRSSKKVTHLNILADENTNVIVTDSVLDNRIYRTRSNSNSIPIDTPLYFMGHTFIVHENGTVSRHGSGDTSTSLSYKLFNRILYSALGLVIGYSLSKLFSLTFETWGILSLVLIISINIVYSKYDKFRLKQSMLEWKSSNPNDPRSIYIDRMIAMLEEL